MDIALPIEGSVSVELATRIHEVWIEEASTHGIDVASLVAGRSLGERIAWARSHDLQIGGPLSRYSSKLQHSTQAQLMDCVIFAARNRIYVPPEFACIDEGVSGRKVRRHGLDRMKLILGSKHIDVLLVYKMSRLLRSGHKSFQFVQEDVVEENLRAISISQGIDTSKRDMWKALLYLHGIMDELLLATIADHVRSSLKDLFREGYVTGAIPVGYRRKIVENGRPTKLGRPRTVPEIDPEAAALIIRHFEYHADGMPIVQGWKAWVAAGGPFDPRSTLGQMSDTAYRKLLSNPRLTGLWGFGKMRNLWKSKLDYTVQELQPECDVTIRRCEELRIVSEELFHTVQAQLAKRKRGAPGPKRRNGRSQLWDWVAECFICAVCHERFYHYGGGGATMICKRGALCPCKTSLRRKDAVLTVLAVLQELLKQDTELVAMAIAHAQELDGRPDEDLEDEIARTRKEIASCSREVQRKGDLLGTDDEDEAKRLKAEIEQARLRRSQLKAELARLERRLSGQRTPITPEQVTAYLSDLTKLLFEAAAGGLGPESIGKAVQAFKSLVGGKILVHVERRPGRKRTVVRGIFTPYLVDTAANNYAVNPRQIGNRTEVTIWLRKPPAMDLLAIRVHELVDDQHLSYSEAADVLDAEGHGRKSAVYVSILYGRYYEMVGQPRPPHGYNNGRPRKPSTPRE
jgi:site-specific DNA recombinase